MLASISSRDICIKHSFSEGKQAAAENWIAAKEKELARNSQERTLNSASTFQILSVILRLGSEPQFSSPRQPLHSNRKHSFTTRAYRIRQCSQIHLAKTLFPDRAQHRSAIPRHNFASSPRLPIQTLQNAGFQGRRAVLCQMQHSINCGYAAQATTNDRLLLTPCGIPLTESP